MTQVRKNSRPQTQTEPTHAFDVKLFSEFLLLGVSFWWLLTSQRSSILQSYFHEDD